MPLATDRGLQPPADALDSVAERELSTDGDLVLDLSVDGLHWRLGLVVPKRHAKRAVTRSLVKRRMRVLWLARLADMPAGDWLVRLTSPLDRKLWPSAASVPLAHMVTAELTSVLDDAVRRARRGAQPPKHPATPPATAAEGPHAAEPSA